MPILELLPGGASRPLALPWGTVEELWPGGHAPFEPASSRDQANWLFSLPSSASFAAIVRPALIHVHTANRTAHGSHRGAATALIILPGGGLNTIGDIGLAVHGGLLGRRFESFGLVVFALGYRVPMHRVAGVEKVTVTHPWPLCQLLAQDHCHSQSMSQGLRTRRRRAYSLPSKRSTPAAWAPLQDAQRAVRLVRSRAAEWGVNASRIGVLGISAGAYLALHLAASAPPLYRDPPAEAAPAAASHRPDFVLAASAWGLADGGVEPNHRNGTALGAEFVDAAGLLPASHPPTALFHAADDATAPASNSMLYALALRRASPARVALHVYPRGGHAFSHLPSCDLAETEQLVAADKLTAYDYRALHESDALPPTLTDGACDWTLEARAFLQTLGLLPFSPCRRLAGARPTSVAPVKTSSSTGRRLAGDAQRKDRDDGRSWAMRGRATLQPCPA